MVTQVDTSENVLETKIRSSAEQKKKAISILVIGELGAGSEEFSEDSIIGLAEELRQRKARGDSPDIVVINNVLPFIPKFSTASNDNKLTTLKEGIENLSDASAMIKPHIQRIMDNLSENSKVFYTYGEDDWKNIEGMKKDLRYEYAYPSKKLEETYYLYLKEVIDREEIAKTSSVAIHKAEKDLKAAKANSGKNSQSYQNKLKVLEDKELDLARTKTEIKELKDIIMLFNDLQTMRTASTDTEELSKMAAEARSELKDIRQSMTSLQKVGKDSEPEFELLDAKAKAISVRLRTISKRLGDASEVAQTEERKKRPGARLGTTIPMPPEAAKTIDELGEALYRRALGDAFGRRNKVEIMPLNANRITVAKQDVSLNLLISHKLGGSAGLAKQSSGAVAQMVGRMLENLHFNPNIVITAHNAATAFGIKPLEHNSKKVMYVLNQGPLWDVAKVFNEAIAGRKTEKTSAESRGSVDSGVSILTYDKDGQVTREALTHMYLLRKRAENDEREAKLLPSLKKSLGKVLADDSIDVTKAVLNEGIAKAKRPSELNSLDLSSITKEDLASLIKYKTGTKGLGETDGFRLGVFSDVHYGSDCDVSLLEGAVKDAMDKKINLLVLDGDMIEGALGYFKRELRENKRPEIADAYKKFLEAKGLSNAAIDREMDKFYHVYVNNLSRNTEEQAYGLIKRMEPLIQDVISRGGSIIVVSGNHYNKTGRDNEVDEAERLASVIKPYIDGMKASNPGSVPDDWESHIKLIHGGETGAGEMSIGKTNIFAAHKPVNVDRQSNHSDIVVVGHEHDYEERQVGDTFILKMFHMQKSESSYVQTFGIPIGKGLNGWGYFDVERNDEGRVIKVVSHPVLRETLIKKGMIQDNPLYNEFWEKYNNVSLTGDKKKSKSS
jgi:predicted phosphodiesterase